MLMLEWILVLLLAAVVLTNLAERMAVPYPSLLAIAGAGLAFLPFAPQIRIEPELALALFVAPALLDAAFDTSPRGLRSNAIPVASLAVFAVALTTWAIAFLGWRFAGLPIAAAIALGAIVAPPDAVAANEVLRHLRIPQRIGLVLQGESLLNDATALLIYRAAVHSPRFRLHRRNTPGSRRRPLELSGRACRYPLVVEMLPCPSVAWTSGNDSPRSIACEPWACRSQCGDTASLMPAAFAARFTMA
jgi:hypothetical protein